jgi:hypothetical protein
LAKPNYSFAKRQRELAKKQKQEAKRLRKAAAESPSPGPQGGEAAQEPTPAGDREQTNAR